MRVRLLGRVAVLAGLVAATVFGPSVGPLYAQQETEGAHSVLPWAFVLNDPVPEPYSCPRLTTGSSLAALCAGMAHATAAAASTATTPANIVAGSVGVIP